MHPRIQFGGREMHISSAINEHLNGSHIRRASYRLGRTADIPATPWSTTERQAIIAVLNYVDCNKKFASFVFLLSFLGPPCMDLICPTPTTVTFREVGASCMAMCKYLERMTPLMS